MTVRVSIPAISRELEFLAQHVDESDEIWEGDVEADENVLELFYEIYERAERDVLQLLNCVRGAVDTGLHNLLRIKWGRISLENWELNGVIYMPSRRSKKRIGSVGFYVECDKAPRLVGWVYPGGGLDGRRELTRLCVKKIDGVHLASDHRDRYSDWPSDAVVWLDEKLVRQTKDQLRKQVQKGARGFFKLAKPMLKRLAG